MRRIRELWPRLFCHVQDSAEKAVVRVLVREQNRHGHLLHDLTCDAAQDNFAQECVAIGSHDDEVTFEVS